MELFAIFKPGEATPIWAKVTTQEEADRVAVVAAVNGGNCELLSGRDLATRLMEDPATTRCRECGQPIAIDDDMWRHAGSGSVYCYANKPTEASPA